MEMNCIQLLNDNVMYIEMYTYPTQMFMRFIKVKSVVFGPKLVQNHEKSNEAQILPKSTYVAN